MGRSSCIYRQRFRQQLLRRRNICGIHGFINGSTRHNRADEFLGGGFVAGSLRGTDASGIASIDIVTSDVVYQKLPVPGYLFRTDKYAHQLMLAGNGINTMSICHTRAATQGGGGLNNAHPFTMYDSEAKRSMVGVHNGTLTGWNSKPGAKSYSVDSEWALNHIFEKGLEAFEDFVGAYCFVWWDSNEANKLNIALNSERPMYVALLKDGAMAYASEAGMLYWLLDRYEFKIEGKIRQLSARNLYQFEVGKLSEFTKTELPSPKYNTSSGQTGQVHQGNNWGRTRRGGGQGSATFIERFDKFLETVGAAVPKGEKETEEGTKTATAKASVRAEEIVAAKDLRLMGSDGVFEPTMLDTKTGYVYGHFLEENYGVLDAIIRGASGLMFNKDTRWNVTCIGVKDEKNELTAICSLPKSVALVASSVH